MTRTFKWLLIAVLLCFSTGVAALAQLHQPPAPPTASEAPSAPARGTRVPPPTPPATDPIGMTIALYYGVIVLLGGAAIAVSVMPGKRGHQD